MKMLMEIKSSLENIRNEIKNNFEKETKNTLKCVNINLESVRLKIKDLEKEAIEQIYRHDQLSQNHHDLYNFKLTPQLCLFLFLDSLKPREKFILFYKYGLFGSPLKTFKEIAPLVGITASRVSHIEATAMRRLRHPSRANQYKHLVDDKLTHDQKFFIKKVFRIEN